MSQKKAKNWKISKKDIFPSDAKKIVAAVVEIAVNVAMSTHIYKFCRRYFIQQNGGPIGLTSTASLASLIMKIWDSLWMKLLSREGINLLLFMRYVDDVRNFLRPLYEGVRWNGCNFDFNESWEVEDIMSGKTDQERTTEQLVLAMSSIISFLEFEGEEGVCSPMVAFQPLTRIYGWTKFLDL